MAARPVRTLAVCSGVGGLELGLSRVLYARVECWVERDPYAVQVLRDRFRDGRLQEAPVWDDLTTFDGHAWEGKVDCVAGGVPCQPYSTAGKKRGAADERDLVLHFLRVVHETQAGIAVVENVQRFVRARGGLDRLLLGLAELGLDAEWGVVGARDAGAPHRRNRVFVVAVSHAGRHVLREQLRRRGRTRGNGEGVAGLVGEEARLAHADEHGREGQRRSRLQHGQRRSRLQHGQRPALGDDSDGPGGEAVGHADGTGRPRREESHEVRKESRDRRQAVGDTEPGDARRVHSRQGKAQEGDDRRTHASAPGQRAGAAGREGLGHANEPRLARRSRAEQQGTYRLPAWPPGPEDLGAWREVLQHRPDLEPSVRGVADGVPAGLVRDRDGRIANRRPQLRCLGNAVSPPQAALALEELIRRACE